MPSPISHGPDLAPFDVIYIAPPQYKGMWLKALQVVDERPELLAPGGIVIVQIFPKEWNEVPLAHLVQIDRRQYGSTALHFLSPAGLPQRHEATETDAVIDPETPRRPSPAARPGSRKPAAYAAGCASRR